MPKRYQHDPITVGQFSRALDATGLSMREFARSTGADIRRVQRWLKEEQDIPLWALTWCMAVAHTPTLEHIERYVLRTTWDTRVSDCSIATAEAMANEEAEEDTPTEAAA